MKMYDFITPTNQAMANVINAMQMDKRNKRQAAQDELNQRYMALDEQRKQTNFQTNQELAAQQEEMNALNIQAKETDMEQAQKEREKQEGLNRLIMLNKIAAGVKDQGTLDAARGAIGNLFGQEALEDLPEQYNEETKSWLDSNSAVLSQMLQKEGNLKEYWVAPEGSPDDRQPVYVREGTDVNRFSEHIKSQGLQFVAAPNAQIEVSEKKAQAQQEQIEQEQTFEAEQNELDRQAEMEQKQAEIQMRKEQLQQQMSRQDRSVVNKLSSDFKRDPFVGRFKEIASQMDNMRQASDIARQLEEEGVTDAQSYSAVDQAYVVSMNKFFDPKSAVMEGEFNRYGINRSVMNRVNGYLNKITNGEGLLPAERNDIEELTGRLYKASLDKYAKVADKYKRKAADLGIDAEKYSGYITDYSDEDVAELQKDYSDYTATTGYDSNIKPLSKDENRHIRNSIRSYREKIQNLMGGDTSQATNNADNTGQPQIQHQTIGLDDFKQKYGF
jgi:hypothetical protein